MGQNIKVISGILAPLSGFRSRGSATINFSDGSLVSGSNASFWEKQIIGSGNIIGKPCKQISLRKMSFTDSDNNSSVGFIPIDIGKNLLFDLDDHFMPSNNSSNPTGIKITWNSSPTSSGNVIESEIAEISFMIIGIV